MFFRSAFKREQRLCGAPPGSRPQAWVCSGCALEEDPLSPRSLCQVPHPQEPCPASTEELMCSLLPLALLRAEHDLPLRRARCGPQERGLRSEIPGLVCKLPAPNRRIMDKSGNLPTPQCLHLLNGDRTKPPPISHLAHRRGSLLLGRSAHMVPHAFEDPSPPLTCLWALQGQGFGGTEKGSVHG